jgi:hypothetical protein
MVLYSKKKKNPRTEDVHCIYDCLCQMRICPRLPIDLTSQSPDPSSPERENTAYMSLPVRSSKSCLMTKDHPLDREMSYPSKMREPKKGPGHLPQVISVALRRGFNTNYPMSLDGVLSTTHWYASHLTWTYYRFISIFWKDMKGLGVVLNKLWIPVCRLITAHCIKPRGSRESQPTQLRKRNKIPQFSHRDLFPFAFSSFFALILSPLILRKISDPSVPDTTLTRHHERNEIERGSPLLWTSQFRKYIFQFSCLARIRYCSYDKAELPLQNAS